jgi:hypothetical protein
MTRQLFYLARLIYKVDLSLLYLPRSFQIFFLFLISIHFKPFLQLSVRKIYRIDLLLALIKLSISLLKGISKRTDICVFQDNSFLKYAEL